MDLPPMETNKEYVWCAKLATKTPKKQWEGRDDGAMEQLVLKRACLGVGAKDNERNIIQVTSFDHKQNKVEACVCSLRLGKQEDVSLSDLTIVPPAIFTLVQGSGPVHLVGNHMVVEESDDLSDDEDYEMGDEDVEASDEEEVGTVTFSKDAGKQGKVNGKPASKKSPEVVEIEDEDFEEVDSDEEEEEDDEEDEEEDEEDEEEDEEEIPEPKSKKRKPVSSKMSTESPLKKKKEADNTKVAKTPQKETETPKKKVGTPKTPLQQKENKTPGSAKKTPAKVYGNLEEIQIAIKKFPGGKPKKEEKFCNWVKHSFKITNEQWLKSLWNAHKKEMAL